MHFRRISFLISVFLLSIVFSFAGEKPTEAEKTDDQLLREKINQEVLNIKCNFKDLGKMFRGYIRYFPELDNESYYEDDWTVLSKTRKCEDVAAFLMEKERKRWTHDFKIITPKEGIITGNIILYGHYIKPPYEVKVDYEKGSITINNVETIRVNIPDVERPKRLKKTYWEKRKTEARRVRLYERKIRRLDRKDLKRRIEEWKQKYSHAETLKKLEERLSMMKEERWIKDYWIYDKDKLLFDLKYFYLDEYKDVPVKYYYTEEEWAKKVKENPELGYTEEEREEYDEQLSQRSLKMSYEDYLSLLQRDDSLRIEQPYGFLYMSPGSFKHHLYVLFSEGTDYQKIVALSKLEDFDTAKELVFNFNRDAYEYFLKKIEGRLGE